MFSDFDKKPINACFNETKSKQGFNMWCWDKILNNLVIKN